MRAPLALLAALITTAPAHAAESVRAPSPFSDWAAAVIAGDDRAAHVDRHTEAFDNARRDISRALERRGFAADNLEQFSVEPVRHPGTEPAGFADVARDFAALTARARGGCLFYLTSHGSPDGAVLGDDLAAPRAIARLIAADCANRPTVAVISACYSGVFAPALAGPDRLVLTAARRDRSSFGCGEDDRYPFFDGCLLRTLPSAADFIALAERTRACVRRREHETGMSPPSEPQISVGRSFANPKFGPGG